MRKFIFNTSMISAIFSGFSVVQTTREGPRDWRLLLLWLSWGISIALAIGSVLEKDREAREL